MALINLNTKRRFMSKKEEAVSSFRGNFNCTQSIFSAFAPELGLDRRVALMIATPFGGGIAHLGEVCGAVTGAILVIGLKHGMFKDEDLAAKERACAIAQRFAERFKSKHGSLICRELIGYDLSTPEGYGKAKQEDVFNTQCTKFVSDAVEILEAVIKFA